MSESSRKKRAVAAGAVRTEEIRRVEAVRERRSRSRSRFLSLAAAALVVAGLLGLGALNYARKDQENKERKAEGAGKHVQGVAELRRRRLHQGRPQRERRPLPRTRRGLGSVQRRGQ